MKTAVGEGKAGFSLKMNFDRLAGLAQSATVPYPAVYDFRTARSKVARDLAALELDLPTDSVYGGVRAPLRRLLHYTLPGQSIDRVF